MRLVFLYLLLAGLWTWRLYPEPAVPEDTTRLPRLEKLSRYLMKAPPAVVKPILMSVALLPDTRLAMVDQWLALQPLQQLRELTVKETPMLKKSGSLRDSLLLAWLGQEQLGSPCESYAMIAAAGDRLDSGMMLYALEKLAAHSNKLGDAAGALPILQRALELPNAPWKTLTSYVQAARDLGQESNALRAVSDWILDHPAAQADEHLMEAREMQMTLMLRLGRTQDAHAQQIDYLKESPATGPLPTPDMDRALVSARAADQQVKLIPWLERQLANFPEHELAAKDLLNKLDSDPDYLHWLAEYAAIADRDLPAAAAFSACIRLAATGQQGALARVCSHAEKAKRLPEAEAFLTLALANPLLRSSLLELAQLEVTALKVVSEALRKSPKDQSLHFAATLAEAAAKPSSAATLWQIYLRRFPADLAAQRRLIQVHVLARQPDLALRVYQSLDRKTLSPEDLRQCAVLRQL